MRRGCDKRCERERGRKKTSPRDGENQSAQERKRSRIFNKVYNRTKRKSKDAYTQTHLCLSPAVRRKREPTRSAQRPVLSTSVFLLTLFFFFVRPGSAQLKAERKKKVRWARESEVGCVSNPGYYVWILGYKGWVMCQMRDMPCFLLFTFFISFKEDRDGGLLIERFRSSKGKLWNSNRRTRFLVCKAVGQRERGKG